MTNTNTAERDALLPCPFCGGACEMIESDGGYETKCGDCQVGGHVWSFTREAAAKAWNTRTANASEASAPSDASPSDGVWRGMAVSGLVKAAPPSDRAAVEGVSEERAALLYYLNERANSVIASPDKKAIYAEILAAIRSDMAEIERLRASDTNAAAAPVGQAVDDIIAERDHCEEVIDEILDCVLGTDRPEWSSSYGYADAIRDVENMTTPRSAYRQVPK